MAYNNYAFTYFDFKEKPIDYEKIKNLKYIIVGLETCPKTKKQHHQGFIQFEDKIRLKQAKERFGTDKIHIENIYSKDWCNVDYCEKDGNIVIEKGRRPVKRGQRNDIIKLMEDAKVLSEEELWEKHPIEMLRYNKSVERYQKILLKKISNCQYQLQTIYIWGDSGSGKTRKCYEEYPDLYRVDHGNSEGRLWFDGYHGQETILFDDFRSSVRFAYMLELCDRYPMQLQIKGGYTYKRWKRVLITSNIPPDAQYPNLSEELQPFLRRLTSVIHMTSTGSFHSPDTEDTLNILIKKRAPSPA